MSTLNEKISAWFEPKPNLETTRELLEKRWYMSPGGMWTLHRHNNQPPEKIESFYWEPTHFDKDEAASARLLEAMPNPDLSRGYGDMESSAASFDWRCDPFGDGELKYAQYHKDRKTAVVIAFCKFAGIEA